MVMDWGDKGPAGSWVFEGTTPETIAYSGWLELRPQGNIYVATWRSSEVGTQHGTGIFYNGALLVSRADGPSADDRAALVAYSMTPLGHLQAQWNAATIGGTIATGLGIGGQPPRWEGDRLITYWDNEGYAYPPLALGIAPMGRAYQLRWEKPASGELRFKGVGLEFDNGLAAAWSKAGEHTRIDILAFSPTGPGTAEAEWASMGFEPLGHETIRRS